MSSDSSGRVQTGNGNDRRLSSGNHQAMCRSYGAASGAGVECFEV